jgi:hypothetical protein
MDAFRQRSRWTPVDYALCVGLLALGMAARLWSLADQSVWYDEYITLAALDAGSLWETLKQELTLDWSMVPAYHVLQYAWAHAIARSDYGIRWLSILLSAASFPLLYAIARRVAGRWAAVVALLFLALSPFHLFHAQGIRNYALALTCALASVWCFVRALEDPARRHWWAGNVLANALLVWTHVFGVFLIAAQGIQLLVFRRKPVRGWVAWGLANALMLLPVALWIVQMQNNSGYPTEPRPDLARFHEVVLAHYSHPFNWMEFNVSVNDAYDALGPAGAWLMAPSEANNFVPPRKRWDRRLVLSGEALLVAGGTLAVVRAVRRRGGEHGSPMQSGVLLLLWLVVPAVALFLMGILLQRSVFQERYLIYAYPALYIAMGLGVQALRWNALRVAAIGVLAGLLGVQALAYQVVPIRHDFQGVVRLYRNAAQPGDRLVLHRMITGWLFLHNLGDPEREHVDTGSFEQLATAVERALAEAPRVWVVMPSNPPDTGGDPEETGTAERFMELCRERGWPYTRDVFAGMQNTWLFRVGEGDGGGLRR